MILSFSLISHLVRHSEFSQRTFGPYTRPLRGQGVVDHIRKELIEIESKPDDLEEWTDVLILGFDGAMSCAANRFPDMSAEELAAIVVEMIVFKQTKNENRDWPDWRKAKPGTVIEHDRSQDNG